MNKYFILLLAFAFLIVWDLSADESDKPHAVFIIGTPHYNPDATLPSLANQLELSYGFNCTLIRANYNPEKNQKGLPGLEVLKEADIAIFFLRFLTLPDSQLQMIDDYLKSGKPVVGFRTSSHAFIYPKGHKNESWNDGFGIHALGSKYFMHGKGPTTVTTAVSQDHPLLAGLQLPRQAAGTLYLADIPRNAHVILRGTGQFKRTGIVTNQFGTHEVYPEMTDDVAWTWVNQWGGRVFSTSLGHPETFADENWVRFFINGIHWAADKTIPSQDSVVEPLPSGIPVNAKY